MRRTARARGRAIRSRRSHPRTRGGGGGVDRPTRHRTTALARAAARAMARERARVTGQHLLFIYTFSTACMEWHDGRTTRSKDARVVIEPVCF